MALALFDTEGRLLLQQRPSGKHHGGAWEFPGGKVENGEFPRLALVREIAEELALTIDPDKLECSYFAEEAGEPHIVLFLYTAQHGGDEPVSLDGQDWGWFSIGEARELPLAPMDRQLLEQISRNGA